MPDRGAPARYRPVPAVARAVALLRALGDGQGEASLTGLARLARIHKSTAHGILTTLEAHEFVARDPATLRFRLGRALAALGRAAADRHDLGTLARPYLAHLCRLSGETATLHIPDGEGSVILASAESPHQLKVTARPGHPLPPFAGAVGKVLWAFGPRDRGALPPRLPAYTANTAADPVRYRAEIARVARAGVAYDEAEFLSGVRAVSVPVFRGAGGAGAEAVAALSIVGVAARLSPAALRRLSGPLVSAGRALSEALGGALEPGGREPSPPPAPSGRRPFP